MRVKVGSEHMRNIPKKLLLKIALGQRRLMIK